MENTQENKVEQSSFINDFFKALESSSVYTTLVEQPFANSMNQNNLFTYLNMDVVEDTLRALSAKPHSEINKFMSDGLKWVNETVGRNQDKFVDGDAKALAHRYVNLLAVLAGAPTIFLKIGALTMYSTAPGTVKTWLRV